MSPDEEKQRVRDKINSLLSSNPIDLNEWKRLSRGRYGFVSNTQRSRVWPKILGVNRFNIPDYKRYVKVHRDASQLRCDIDRSFWSLDCAKHWSKKRMARKRAALSDIITAVLVRNPKLHYFQGFHDIVSVLMLVLNDDILVFGVLEAMCSLFFSDFMRQDFTILSRLMRLIMPIIRFADAELYKHLEESCLEPFFATSWLITWLSHDIRNLRHIARIFDVFLCSPPEYCLYFCATLVILQKSHLLKVEKDFSAIHSYLSRMLRPDCAPNDDADLLCENDSSEKKNASDQLKHCDYQENKSPALDTQAYPFDLMKAIEMTDTLVEQLPPATLLELGDTEIKELIIGSNTIMFSNLKENLAMCKRQSFNSIFRIFPDSMICSSRRIVRYFTSVPSTRVAGWLTTFHIDRVRYDSEARKICNKYQGKKKCQDKNVRRSASGPRVITLDEDNKRAIYLALTGGLLSFAAWAAQTYYGSAEAHK